MFEHQNLPFTWRIRDPIQHNATLDPLLTISVRLKLNFNVMRYRNSRFTYLLPYFTSKSSGVTKGTTLDKLTDAQRYEKCV